MIELSDYEERIFDRINMIGMWVAIVVSFRNLFVCLRQYRRTRGKIHLANIAQVVVFIIHKFLYGIIPLFEIQTCAYFPLLVSLWHLDYLLFYIVMFMRLLIIEPDFHSRWIKIAGAVLILIRFSVWPFELTYINLQIQIMQQPVTIGATCWADWGGGVIVWNFVSDVLANLFLSGMFVRRLYLHVRQSETVMTHQNRVIERIARKSLICFILTFIVNLAMNLLKVTTFVKTRSDAFTVYFALVESTLLVEALRVDYMQLTDQKFCEHCGLSVRSSSNDQKKNNEEYLDISLKMPESFAAPCDEEEVIFESPSATSASAKGKRSSSSANLFATSSHDTCNHYPMFAETAVDPDWSPSDFADCSTPPISLRDPLTHRAIPIALTKRSPPDPVNIFGSVSLQERPEWSNNDYRMF